MSADVLRRAAALMRERAEAATSVTGASDWFASLRGLTHAADYSVRSSGGVVAGDTAEEEAEHIASWHPEVAVAVADLLDEYARLWDASERTDDLRVAPLGRYLLTVARAYLGEQS